MRAILCGPPPSPEAMTGGGHGLGGGRDGKGLRGVIRAALDCEVEGKRGNLLIMLPL